MASIQQSINNLISAGFAGTVGAAYLYKGTPRYEAKELETQAKNLNKYWSKEDAANITKENAESYKTLAQKSVELREKAYEKSPTPERLAAVEKAKESQKEVDEAARVSKLTPQELQEEKEQEEAMAQQEYELAEKEKEELGQYYKTEEEESAFSPQQTAETNSYNRLENKMASQINQKMGFEELKKYVNSMSSLTKDERKQITQNFFKAEQREKSKAQSEEAKRKNGTN